jgi:hypothetical protein
LPDRGVHQTGTGSAHHNYAFRTFSFLLDPLIRIPQLSFVFEDAEEALPVVRQLVRNQLVSVAAGEQGGGLERDWVERGTQDWSDFSAFVFAEHGIEVLFAPYHVAAFAYGPQSATLRYEDINGMMKPVFVSALEIEYFRYRGSKAEAPA